MKCIIPCGGFGTRMQDLGFDKPKALVEVKGKPILEHILRRVEQVDEVDEVFVVSNSLFLKDFSDWINRAEKAWKQAKYASRPAFEYLPLFIGDIFDPGQWNGVPIFVFYKKLII